MEKIELSVVIPSYNSEKTIFDCINNLVNQSYTKSYEIIFVDSSTDRTREIVSENFKQVKIIQLPPRTDPGTARNTGVKEAKGKYILFIDSDCIASKDWIEKIMMHYNENNYAAVGGSVIPANPPNDHVGWAGYISEFRDFIPEHPAAVVSHIPTCNLSFKKEIFEKEGGFDPTLYPQEDLYYNYKLSQKKEKIFFDPSIIVNHWHRSELSPFLKHQYNIGYVTSSVLQIADLEGSKLINNKVLAVLALPMIPFIKFIRTLKIFLNKNTFVLTKHPISILIFFMGLIPWIFGFGKGIFKPKFKDYHK